MSWQLGLPISVYRILFCKIRSQNRNKRIGTAMRGTLEQWNVYDWKWGSPMWWEYGRHRWFGLNIHYVGAHAVAPVDQLLHFPRIKQTQPTTPHANEHSKRLLCFSETKLCNVWMWFCCAVRTERQANDTLSLLFKTQLCVRFLAPQQTRSIIICSRTVQQHTQSHSQWYYLIPFFFFYLSFGSTAEYAAWVTRLCSGIRFESINWWRTQTRWCT